jgi:hypothetical protein
MSLQVQMIVTLPEYEGKQPESSGIYDVYRIIRAEGEKILSCLILVDRQTFYKVQDADFIQVP